MTCSRWITKNVMLAAFVWSMNLAAYPVRAQNLQMICTKVTNTSKPESWQAMTGQGSIDYFPLGLALTMNQTPEIQEQLSEKLQASRLAEIGRYYDVLARFQDTTDDILGANLQPVGDALRAQIDIPPGQGLVVEGLRGDGACAQAGLQQNDILLSLADKPLATTDDLIKQLKAAGDSPAPLHVLRAGKPVTIQVRPIYRVTLGPVGKQKTEQYIGISVVGPNDATRAQLGLTDGKGMVVAEVEKGSPAEQGGIKKYDIVLELNGKPIDSPETLQRQVQVVQDHQATLKILRAGKPVTISILTSTRKVEVNPNSEAGYRVLLLNRAEDHLARLALGTTLQSGPVDFNQSVQKSLVQNGQPVDANDLRQRLEHLEKELTAVRAALDKINETLKANKGSK
jgi:S1-C subfamily serine protease